MHKFLSLLFLASLVSCAHGTQKDSKLDISAPNSKGSPNDSTSIEAKLAAAEDGSSDVTDIKFKKTSSHLSEKNKKKNEAALARAQKQAKITHSSIVAWSDEEMPKHSEKNLSKGSIELASTRAQVIKDYLQNNHPGFGIEIVNMAKRPGKFKDFLETNDVRIQKAFATAGTGDSKASHAIIIIETDQK
jgi:hypothetical protein